MWGKIVIGHLLTNQISDQEMTTSRWGIIVVSQIYQLFLDIWIPRNIDGHHLTEKYESQLSRQFNKITTLQESNPEVRYYDRDFSFCPIESLENYSLSNLKSWYQPACSIIKAQQKYRSQQRPDSDYFPVVLPSNIQHLNASLPLSELDPPNVLVQTQCSTSSTSTSE
jgi:hypothetical protein